MLPGLRDLDAHRGPGRRSVYPGDAAARAGLRTMRESGVLLVSERSGAGTGFVGGMFTAHPFVPDLRVLCAVVWWVDPSFRADGLRLLDEFVSIGRAEADQIIFALQSSRLTGAHALERRGFQERERVYVWES